jgi:hypothetical protein
MLLRKALKGTLATLDRGSGHPYASLVTVATEPDGSPLLLISRLALHTQNLQQDARASILIDGTGSDDDPLAGGRVTLIGSARPATSPTARRRFLARHPEAQHYAGFPDFAFYELAVERAHYVGGFGRIVTLAPEDILTDVSAARALIDAEPDVITHMNEDHAETLALYATHLLGAQPQVWSMTGVDPDGFDIKGAGQSLRMAFTETVQTPEDARRAFVSLARLARQRAAQG